MKIFAIGLLILQIIASVALLVVAFIEIEWILAAGPTLTVIGLLLGWGACRLQSKTTLGFALSGPIICALVSFLIAAFRWNPEDARVPTQAILAAYLMIVAPLAIISARHILSWEKIGGGRIATLFQFRLKSLLIAMTATCIVIAGIQFAVNEFRRRDFLMFGGFTVVTLACTGLVVWGFLARAERV